MKRRLRDDLSRRTTSSSTRWTSPFAGRGRPTYFAAGGLAKNGIVTTFDPETDEQPRAPGRFAHPHQFSVALTAPAVLKLAMPVPRPFMALDYDLLDLALRSRPLEPYAHSGGSIVDRLSLGSWRNRNAPLSCRRGSKSRYLHGAQTRSDRPRERRRSARHRDEISPFYHLNDAVPSSRRLLPRLRGESCRFAAKHGVTPARCVQPR